MKLFCKQVGFVENKQLKLVLFVFFFKFYIWLSRLLSQNLEKNSIEVIFAEENLVVDNKDNRVFMSRNYIGLIVTPWKFDVLKTSIFALEASLLRQIWINYRLIVAPAGNLMFLKQIFAREAKLRGQIC